MLASAHSWIHSRLPELCVENLWDWFSMQVLTVFIRWCLTLPAPETGVFRVLDGQTFKNADYKVKKMANIMVILERKKP